MKGITTVRAEGLREMVRQLEEVGLEVEDLKDAFSAVAARGASIAKGFAPADSGALIGSIRGNRAKSKAVVAAGYAKRVPYAGGVNYGWPNRGVAPNRFMQKTSDAMAPIAMNLLTQEIDKIIRRKGLS